nr:immunoglobulin heavy chain junction region [Macaca mulatta]
CARLANPMYIWSDGFDYW